MYIISERITISTSLWLRRTRRNQKTTSMYVIFERTCSYLATQCYFDTLGRMPMVVAPGPNCINQRLPSVSLSQLHSCCHLDLFVSLRVGMYRQSKRLPVDIEAQRLCIMGINGRSHTTATLRICNAYKLQKDSGAKTTVSVYGGCHVKPDQHTAFWAGEGNDRPS